MHFLSCGGELNHHGKPVCDELYKLLDENFKRITTVDVADSRIKLGYNAMDEVSYNEKTINATKEEITEIIKWADVVDYGAAPEEYLHEAVKQNKVVFIRIERLFKQGFLKMFYLPVFMKYYRKYIRYRNNPNVYFLCTSAYAAGDLAKIGVKNNRVLSWAYCPKFITLSNDTLENNSGKLQLVWCGRLISWKHPELSIIIAEQLKQCGCNFALRIIGTGVLEENLKEMVKQKNLENYVEFCGATPSEDVVKIMQSSDVFLTTSDRNEGWGVVLNEGMNNGCAVFATKAMGSAPVLIKENENGFFINPKDIKKTVEKICELDKDRELLKKYKIAAYETIKNGYTPEVYAKVFVELAEDSLKGSLRLREGLGAKAYIIK